SQLHPGSRRQSPAHGGVSRVPRPRAEHGCVATPQWAGRVVPDHPPSSHPPLPLPMEEGEGEPSVPSPHRHSRGNSGAKTAKAISPVRARKKATRWVFSCAERFRGSISLERKGFL